MDDKIRVLGIAPYEGMKLPMSALASEYPQIELTIFVGDLEQGVEIAKSNFHGNYDVVISRGGTAKMLRQHQSLPVIEIDISAYDILCTLKLADGHIGKSALVSFADITANARMLCNLIGYDMDIYTIDSPEMVEPTLLRLRQENYQSILCDMIGNTTAKRLGLNSFLITSGVESIRRSFDQALMLCSSQQHLRHENQFFRELIQGQLSETVVFDMDGHIILSTLTESAPGLVALLRKEIQDSQQQAERRIIRTLNGMMYSIRARQLSSGGIPCIAFFVVTRKAPLSPNQHGIRFSTRPEVERAFYDSIFSFAGTVGDFQDEIFKLIPSNAPILVSGEHGTGKESIISAIYMQSALCNNPLISINCSLLNDKSWIFLLEHHNSPLSDINNTLFFSNIDVLPPERSQQLLAILSEMDVCRRNRVIFSCVCQTGEYISPQGSLFQDKLRCLSLYLPPLRQSPDRIPTLVNLSLSHLNADLAHQILGVEPGAITLLKNYPWPHNYTQFRRVLEELATTTTNSIITEAEVRQVLRRECPIGTLSPQTGGAPLPLDLSRPLDVINREIARIVVAGNGGNQTSAAKQLGISRTTLWRLLQNQ